MTLVQTREKLKPFVDDGVVHKDRKKQVKKASDDFANQKKDADLEEIIVNYRVDIAENIRDKNILRLEQILRDLAQEIEK